MYSGNKLIKNYLFYIYIAILFTLRTVLYKIATELFIICFHIWAETHFFQVFQLLLAFGAHSLVFCTFWSRSFIVANVFNMAISLLQYFTQLISFRFAVPIQCQRRIRSIARAALTQLLLVALQLGGLFFLNDRVCIVMSRGSVFFVARACYVRLILFLLEIKDEYEYIDQISNFVTPNRWTFRKLDFLFLQGDLIYLSNIFSSTYTFLGERASKKLIRLLVKLPFIYKKKDIKMSYEKINLGAIVETI